MRQLISLFALFLSINSFSQDERLALIIGNSEYLSGGRLANPVNDALEMSKALSKAGFDVSVHYNLNQKEMRKVIDDFGEQLKDYQVGLFFYAGHGIQAKGYNYLIPVEADLNSEQDVEYDCVKADRVLAKMDAAGADVNIMILDACRNNPFERSWSRATQGMGLAYMNAPRGTLIAYATAPGSTASDGEGKNGLYTSAILENINTPSITILKMFQNVRSTVTEKSNNEQTPWESTSLVGDFYVIPPKEVIEEDPIAQSMNDRQTGADSEVLNIDSEKADYSKGRAVFHTVLLPGTGLTKATGNPHWIKGVAAYGLLGGSVALNRMAVSNYKKFLVSDNFADADAYFKTSSIQDQVSELMVYTAIGLWLTEIVWTYFHFSGQTDSGLSLSSVNKIQSLPGDPVVYTPAFNLCLTF